ncbi:MAG: MerR family transcriptional regulator [Methylibium sp. NZG]|nr:MAG: MerR family transcriptional regulator [Methylibium sp. NZG]
MPDRAASTATPPSQTFTIGELAREFDLTTRAIRFYEDCGLLRPQRHGRNRVYTARDRTRLKLTLRGKRLGLTLAEVKELVDMYESPRDTQPQLKKFLLVLAAHRSQLEQQLADLHATLDEVRAQEREARRLLNTADKKGAEHITNDKRTVGA